MSVLTQLKTVGAPGPAWNYKKVRYKKLTTSPTEKHNPELTIYSVHRQNYLSQDHARGVQQLIFSSWMKEFFHWEVDVKNGERQELWLEFQSVEPWQKLESQSANAISHKFKYLTYTTKVTHLQTFRPMAEQNCWVKYMQIAINKFNLRHYSNLWQWWIFCQLLSTNIQERTLTTS